MSDKHPLEQRLEYVERCLAVTGSGTQLGVNAAVKELLAVVRVLVADKAKAEEERQRLASLKFDVTNFASLSPESQNPSDETVRKVYEKFQQQFTAVGAEARPIFPSLKAANEQHEADEVCGCGHGSIRTCPCEQPDPVLCKMCDGKGGVCPECCNGVVAPDHEYKSTMVNPFSPEAKRTKRDDLP